MSTSFGTVSASPKALTSALSSSSEASMQSGTVIFGASATARPEGWSSTPAAKGVSAVQARDTIYHIAVVSERGSGSGAVYLLTFAPQQYPTTPSFVTVSDFLTASTTPISFSSMVPALAGPDGPKYLPMALPFSGVSGGNQAGSARLPTKKSGIRTR